MPDLIFLDLVGLTEYDNRSKTRTDEKIAEAISTSLKGVALSEDSSSLLFYTQLPIEGATPEYELEIPSADLSGVIEKFETATSGNVITVADDGKTISDSGISLMSLAKQSDLETVHTIADEAKTKVDALEALVGVIPDGYEAKTIVEYIQEVIDIVAGSGYDDTELQHKVANLQSAIDKLNSDATVEGSVEHTVHKVIAEILANDNASFDTLKEMQAWMIDHADSAATMNEQIQSNTTAIDALRAYVGTIPEGSSSTNVVAYITEALEKADLTKYALASDLQTAIDRITANEQAINVINSSLSEGGFIYEKIITAQETGDNAQSAVDLLKSYVGNFAVDDESVDTVVKYVDYKVAHVLANIETRLTIVESTVKSKAEQTALDELANRVSAVEENVSTNTTDIESLQATVDSIGSIPTSDIYALFTN